MQSLHFYLRLPTLVSVCYPSLTRQRTLIVSVYNWSSIYDHEFIFMFAVPVAMLRVMNSRIINLWLTDDEWVWEGDKLPCKFNDFSKMVFITSLQGFFHFLEGFITRYVTVNLKKGTTIVQQFKRRILHVLH